MSLEAWQDALTGAAVIAVDPAGVGGAVLRARAGPVASHFCRLLRGLLPEGTPVRRLPAHVTEDRLLGGLDLAGTLRAGRVVAERGLLVDAHGGVVLAPMAERLEPIVVAHVGSALDRGEVVVERDGVGGRAPTRFGVVALDEGEGDERVAPALSDRLGLHLDVDAVPPRWTEDVEAPFDGADVVAARARLDALEVSDGVIEAFCKTAQALGVGSARAPLLALRVARAHAALRVGEAGEGAAPEVTGEDASFAARVVLGPRATTLPAAEEEPPEASEPPPPPPEENAEPPERDEEEAPDPTGPLDDLVLAAAEAHLPEGLLARLAAGRAPRGGPKTTGPAGALAASKLRGRPSGVRRAGPRSGGRLNVIETLRAAAPWQKLRRRAGERKVEVRQDDFRVTRYRKRSESLTIFAVDASGSSALQRLAEAKGAVEQVLADCYVRRDSVALIGFRGDGAELLLPPTKSLARAKRTLAELPGGGATPIASGIDAAIELAEDATRRGRTPVVVVMTDGRANVARDGTRGRGQAEADALVSARALRERGVRSIFVDTAPRPRPAARALAEAMDAFYLALPRVDARGIASAVRATADAGGATAGR
jgi:magnesium chelatase subunit D